MGPFIKRVLLIYHFSLPFVYIDSENLEGHFHKKIYSSFILRSLPRFAPI